jgi:hypothetical protein
MYCNGCGSSIGAEAFFCSLCGTRQPVAQTLALPQPAFPPQSGRVPGPLRRSYRWGQIHGAGLIAAGLIFLKPHPSPVTIFSSIFLVVLGICVLRRNKLILPLMVAWPLAQLFVLLNHPVFPGELPVFPPLFPLILWCAYIVYYYRRRDEFVKWV